MMVQLETTLGFKYEVNNTNLHIQRESDIISEDYDATIGELSNSESKLKPKQEVDDKMEHAFVSICDEKFIKKEELLDVTEQHQEMVTIVSPPLLHKDSDLKDSKNFTIKSEILDITEQPEEADLQEPKLIMIIKENRSDEEGTIDDVNNASETSGNDDPVVDKDREDCGAIKQEWNDLIITPLTYRSNGSLFNKELRVVLEDVMLTLEKQNTQDSSEEAANDDVSYLKAQSVKNKEKKNRREARTSTIDGKIDFTNYDAEDVFICDICNKSYKQKKTLYQHIQGHLKLFNCTYCSFSGHNKSNLNIHINAKHTKKIIYNCSYCIFSTHNRNTLSSHENSQHTKNTVYNCSYCDYKTFFKGALNRHINIIHTKTEVFNCSYCNYKTYNKNSLTRHVNSKHINYKHTNNTVYNCSYCDYKTFFKGTLKRHINVIHTKTEVFNCSYCNYKTYYKNSLARHINSKHTKKTVSLVISREMI